MLAVRQNHPQYFPHLVLVFGFETESPVSPDWPRTHDVVQKKAESPLELE